MEMITANDMAMRVALLCQKREMLPVTPKKHSNWYELRQNIKIISVLCNATDNDAEKAHRMLAYLCNYRHWKGEIE